MTGKVIMLALTALARCANVHNGKQVPSMDPLQLEPFMLPPAAKPDEDIKNPKFARGESVLVLLSKDLDLGPKSNGSKPEMNMPK